MYCSQKFKLFAFPVLRFWAYLMKIIPETCRATNFNIYVFIGIFVLVLLFCYKHTITNWRKTTDTRIMLSLGNIALHGFLCLFLSCRWRTNYQTGLALPQLCACSKIGHGFPIFVFFPAVKYCRGEVVLPLIDVGTIADHHCWKFKDNSPIVRFIIQKECIINCFSHIGLHTITA